MSATTTAPKQDGFSIGRLLLEGRAFFALVAIIVVARQLGSRAWAIALGLLLGAAIGNLTDRFVRPPGGGQGDVLAGFFAVQVLAPGLYLDHSCFLDRNTLTDDSAALAASHGSALFDLTVAVRSSPALAALRPQV